MTVSNSICFALSLALSLWKVDLKCGPPNIRNTFIGRESVRVKLLVVIRLLICCVTNQRAVRAIGECSIKHVHKHVVYTVLVLLCSHVLVHKQTYTFYNKTK